MVREGRERGGGSEKDAFKGVVVLESLPLPRVETVIEGSRSGRAFPVPFSVSSRFRARSVTLVLGPTTLELRGSPAPSWGLISSITFSLFGFLVSFVVGLVSPMILLARLDAFSILTGVPYTPFTFGVLLDVEEDGRFLVSCAADCVEFCRPRDG